MLLVICYRQDNSKVMGVLKIKVKRNYFYLHFYRRIFAKCYVIKIIQYENIWYINIYSRTQLYLPTVLHEDICYLLFATDSTIVRSLVY